MINPMILTVCSFVHHETVLPAAKQYCSAAIMMVRTTAVVYRYTGISVWYTYPGERHMNSTR
jgi:hypothetical protein